jgi:hypothetical protein
MKATFQKEVQDLPGCSVSVYLELSEQALQQIYEDSESAHGTSGQSYLLGALLAEIAHLLDQAEITILSNQLETYRTGLSKASN